MIHIFVCVRDIIWQHLRTSHKDSEIYVFYSVLKNSIYFILKREREKIAIDLRTPFKE
jgi:hypothetical protein